MAKPRKHPKKIRRPKNVVQAKLIERKGAGSGFHSSKSPHKKQRQRGGKADWRREALSNPKGDRKSLRAWFRKWHGDGWASDPKLKASFDERIRQLRKGITASQRPRKSKRARHNGSTIEGASVMPPLGYVSRIPSYNSIPNGLLSDMFGSNPQETPPVEGEEALWEPWMLRRELIDKLMISRFGSVDPFHPDAAQWRRVYNSWKKPRLEQEWAATSARSNPRRRGL
jgi:hypothetical protein